MPSIGQDAGATATDAQQSAYQSSIAEESVRKEADRIQVELGQLVAELKLNGLETGNLKMLSQASTHLSGLSREEMQQVINSLQSSSIAADGSKRQQSLVNAYQGQQDLVLKLKKLAAELAMQQTGDQLVNELENLIARQAANIRETTTLTAGGHTADQLSPQEQSMHGVVSAEQTAIGGQIDLLFSSLTTQTAQPPATPDDSSQTVKAVFDAMNGIPLKDTSQAAVQLTSAGPFNTAVEKQANVKDYLTAVLQAAECKADATTRLTQAKNQLDQVMADQNDLSAVTKNSKLNPATLAERQAQINDRADVAKTLVTPLNLDAAKKLDDAQKAMQQSTDALSDPNKQQDTAAKQDEATKGLADADALLDKQIADVQEEQNESPTDQMAQIQKAQEEVKQAQQEQQTNPQQAAQDAQKAQQDALAQSPDAADKLADAADQLQLQQQSPSSADAASKDLAQAAQDLQDQKDALAQAAKDYAALAEASDALDQAQKETADADQNLKTSEGNDLSDPARKLTDAHADVAQVEQTPPQNLPGDAKQAIQKAAEALKNGSSQAVQAHRSGADAQAQQALAALAQAQSSLGQAMAQIQAQSQQERGMGHQAHSSQNAQIGGMGTDNTNALLRGAGADVARGTALVVGGLSPKDRDAITQYQAEKTPPEYAPLVQQYLKNLADVPQSH